MRCLAVLALTTLLGACAQTGDFGRPQPTLYSETIAPFVGTSAAAWRKEPASFSMLTDDERELRNRAYQFLMPARERTFFDTQLADLVRTRILPGDAIVFDETAYYQALWLRPDRSPRARYQALREDMENDRLLMGPFVAVACRVKETDAIRVKAMERLTEVAEIVRISAQNRVVENEEIVRWVYGSLENRVRSYRFALQNLVVETPERDGIKVERELTAFDADRIGLQRCATKTVSVSLGKGDATPRFAPRPEKPDLPPK
jgi:hypothetical protein